MTAPARPLARRWMAMYDGEDGWSLWDEKGGSEEIYLGDAPAEHNALVAAHEADRAVIEALVAALNGMVQEADAYDDRPLEPTCNECTQGSTPLRFDKGPCAYHRAHAALAAAGRAGR